MDYDINFAIAPDHLLKLADEVLRSDIRCAKTTRQQIRRLAKAFIDEADELKRSLRDIANGASNIQIESRSPPDLIELAKELSEVRLASEEMQRIVRSIAASYVHIAQENQRLFEEFEEKYRDNLPPKG